MTVTFDPRIVACGDKIRATLFGKGDQRLQLHALVAAYAGIGRGAGKVTREKIVDDASAERATGVDDFVRDLQALGDVLGDADLAAAALLPALGAGGRFDLF